jgi:hypothetical protein
MEILQTGKVVLSPTTRTRKSRCRLTSADEVRNGWIFEKYARAKENCRVFVSREFCVICMKSTSHAINSSSNYKPLRHV